MSITTLTALIRDMSLRDELPDDYMGKLVTEFHVVVALTNLACTAVACHQPDMATSVYDTSRTFVHLVNSLYFIMLNEKAPRLTDKDVELANAHAVRDLPVQDVPMLGLPERYANAQVIVDHASLDQAGRATSNACTDSLENLEFVVSEYTAKQRKTNKEACRRVYRIQAKLTKALHSIIDMLDTGREQANACKGRHEQDPTRADQARHARKNRRR